MAATRPPFPARSIVLPTILFSVLVLSGALAAQPSTAKTLGPNAFEAEAGQLHQRLQAIAAQTSPGQYPLGTGLDGVLRFAPGADWTSGFWAGALWRDVDLAPSASRINLAYNATVDHLGFERAQTHDLGFMYGESSVAAYERVCKAPTTSDCAKFRASGLIAADTLVKLARTTGQGIIPLGARTCSDCKPGGAETIVDSMMNLPLLYWASRQTGNPKYNNLAKWHAGWVYRNLLRPDGSTFQAASYPRRSKRPRLVLHTHQGLADDSTWSRGQAWSIYGFADAGLQFRNKYFLRAAERNAHYAITHLPGYGVPMWDYDAIKGAPIDVSAGVITAAGLFHLARACEAVANTCRRSAYWAVVAGQLLKNSLKQIRKIFPVGILGDQVYTLAGRETWEDDGELVFGLDYALEAIKLARER
ncbi:MAG: glycoside hydrolase family 88 protein [Thermoleophilaceae bacterium]|nr:glycoside hydrolase family 88 protein [Thermoleophilaceae bacterium]